MRSSYNMLSTMQDDGAKTMKAEMEKNALSHVERRRGNLFKNGVPRPPPTHIRISLFQLYVVAPDDLGAPLPTTTSACIY